jgi:hypothetical protein
MARYGTGSAIASLALTLKWLILMMLFLFMRILCFVYESLRSKKLFWLSVSVCLRAQGGCGKC